MCHARLYQGLIHKGVFNAPRYHTKQITACTLGVDSNLQRHRAVFAATARLFVSNSVFVSIQEQQRVAVGPGNAYFITIRHVSSDTYHAAALNVQALLRPLLQQRYRRRRFCCCCV